MINTIFFMLLIPLQILCKNLDVNHTNINNNSNNETNTNSTIPISTTLAKEHGNFQSFQPYQQPNELNKINYNLLNKVDGRFRRSSQDLLSSTSALSSSVDGQPFNWNVLRYYICGSDNQNCISNERLNKLHQNQNALKNLLPKNIEITVPTSLQQQQQQQLPSSIDWTSSGFHIPPEYLNDANQRNSLNLSGKREGTLYVEEPDYVLVKGNKNNDELQQHLGPDYNDDPFIPQRGKKEYRKQLDGKKNNNMENNFDMINSYPSSYRRSRTKMTTPITDDLNQWKNIILKNKLIASTDAAAVTTHHIGKYKKLLIPNDIVTKNTQCCNEIDNFYNTNNNNNNNSNKNNNNHDMMLMAINDDGEVEQLIPTNNNNNYYKNEDNFNTIMQNKRNLLNNLSHENRDTFYSTRGRNRFRKE